jgi:hypothetical protein
MSQRRKTLTKSIRAKSARAKSAHGKTPRHLRRKNQVKREVAAEAARIIATEGQYNYHAAKKKAAMRIGVSDRLALPSNLEVQEALFSYIQLYGGNDHLENLQGMRAAAAKAMRFLSPLQSRLVGGVLDGTAGRHARITLHVFSDSPDHLVHHLMSRNMPFRQEQRQIRWRHDTHKLMPLLVMELGDHTIEMLVFDELHLRQAPPCPIDGKPQKRASLDEVEQLTGLPAPQAAIA